MKTFIRNAVSLVITAIMVITSATIHASADSGITLPANEAISFVNSMGAGWNLGNSFDSHNCTWLSNKLDYEAGWCGVKASRALIKTVKNAGFDTIRIPVTWYDHVDSAFNIDSAWINRVAEVTDWCLEEDLYVILDVHHDVLHNWYYPSSDELQSSTVYLKKVWEQIADKFRDYSDKVIFEPINEPRLKDTTYEWWYNQYNIPDEVKDSLECINKLNQTALDAIRASGGNNASRYVLVGGYDTDGTWKGALSQYFRLPTDVINNRLIVDAHIYGTNKLDELNGLYNAFTSKGVPVVISEYGLDSEGYDYIGQEAAAVPVMREFGAYARARGISVIIWDNNSGASGQVGHKFIDRATATVITGTLLSEFTKANGPVKTTTVDSVSAIPDQVYTGSAITPAVTVKSGETVLTAGTDYTVSYSNNINIGTATVTVTGSGNYTGTKTATFKIVAAAPEPPTVTVVSGDGQITLNWNKSAGVTKFAVSLYEDGTFTVLSQKLTGTTYTAKNLTNGKEYKFLVQAYNGKWSSKSTKNLVSVTPKSTVPIVIASPGDGEITYNWEAITGATKYAVSIYENEKFTVLTKTLTDTTYTAKNLTNGKEYKVLVQSYTGKWSAINTDYLVSAVPRSGNIPSVTAIPGDRNVYFNWRAVAGATKYAVSIYDDEKYTVLSKTITGNTYTAKNLTNGKEYKFLVQAYTGKWSSVDTKYLISVTPYSTVPEVTVIVGNGKVTFNWKAVPGATKYAVSIYDRNEYTVLNQKITGNTYTAINLTNDREYKFLVQAYTGKWSSSSTKYLISATPKA